MNRKTYSLVATVLLAALVAVPLASTVLSAQARKPATRTASKAGGTKASARPTARGAKGATAKGVKGKPAAKSGTTASAGAAANVAGTWISPQWGEMRLTQVGNKVRGSYDHQNGRVEGTVRGNAVIMNWWEPEPVNKDFDQTIHPERGTARFTLKPKTGTLDGSWRYERTDANRPDDGEWQLRKVAAAPVGAATTAKGALAKGKTTSKTTARGGKVAGRAGAGKSGAGRPVAAASRTSGAARRR